jgi:hypothetical protein
MRDHLSQDELDEIFYGEKPVVEVEFYSKQITDTQASREAGHRVYTQADYVHLACARENVQIHRPVQESDRIEFRSAWNAYQEKQNGLPREVPDVCQEITGDYRKAQTG